MDYVPLTAGLTASVAVSGGTVDTWPVAFVPLCVLRDLGVWRRRRPSCRRVVARKAKRNRVSVGANGATTLP